MDSESLRLILKCVHCGTCRSVCPVFEELGWESTCTRGRMMMARGIFDSLDVDEGVAYSLNTCTTCGLCKQICPAGVDPVNIVEMARKELLRISGPTGSRADLYEKVNSHGNPLGESSSRLSWLGDQHRVAEKADHVYFVGCLGAYRYQRSAFAAYDILKKFNTTILKDERCCGSPLLRMGFDATDLIEHNLEQIERTGAHTVIVSCAGCYTTLKNDYPSSLNVVHITEFLEEHLEELDLKSLDMDVTYHDPCHLGRSNGIYDPPRNIINSICRLKEMDSSREDARCCGGGGGVRKTYPDLSGAIAKKRIEECPQDIDAVITCCPLCRSNLEMETEKKVMDIVDLLNLSMDGAP